MPEIQDKLNIEYHTLNILTDSIRYSILTFKFNIKS